MVEVLSVETTANTGFQASPILNSTSVIKPTEMAIVRIMHENGSAASDEAVQSAQVYGNALSSAALSSDKNGTDVYAWIGYWFNDTGVTAEPGTVSFRPEGSGSQSRGLVTLSIVSGAADLSATGHVAVSGSAAGDITAGNNGDFYVDCLSLSDDRSGAVLKANQTQDFQDANIDSGGMAAMGSHALNLSTVATTMGWDVSGGAATGTAFVAATFQPAMAGGGGPGGQGNKGGGILL